VLIVEDEDLLRWSLVKRLTRSGHDVGEAENIAQAKDFLHHTPPDLIILDLALPDGHGLDLISRHEHLLKNTAVVVLTAVGGADDAQRAASLGVREFLTKPVEHDRLVRLINEWLSSS
jgi:DNA-binding NtrC family response regulator